MRPTSIGTREIDPAQNGFFRAIIEERKTLPKAHPHYLLLKIIANSLYGIFAELNKYEYGKNKAKLLDVFSGEHTFDETTCVIERPGKWHFPPAAALITAGGRLMLSILECMVEDLGGTYLLTDTDSMLFVASQKGGLVACPGGRHVSSAEPAFSPRPAKKWRRPSKNWNGKFATGTRTRLRALACERAINEIGRWIVPDLAENAGLSLEMSAAAFEFRHLADNTQLIEIPVRTSR